MFSLVWEGLSFSLELAPAFHGFEHSDFVSIFDVAAGGETGSDAGDANSEGLDLLREVGCSRFALDRGIGRDDHFIGMAAFEATKKIGNPQMLRTDAVQRRK